MEEKVIISPFYHDHSLILKENVGKDKGVDCYGCGNLVANLEMVYVCIDNNCRSSTILHKKCGELPSEIRHPKHPDHPLHLFNFHVVENHFCDVCRKNLDDELGYRCSSCDFDVDITCEEIRNGDILLEDRKELQHPSHPNHPLTLMRKPAFEFSCDGCGDRDVDMAYICSKCEFWVHRRCAELPLDRECRHHHHHLSMAFSFPKEHRKYLYRCGVCDKLLGTTSCWVYFCGNCKYFVHINCVDQSTTTPNINEDEEDGVIQFPLDAKDMSNKLITPFVMREKGLDNIPTPTSNLIFLSNYHDHPLSLVLEEANRNSDDYEEEEEELIKICDVCVTPISSSSPYYHCPTSSCNYFIHSICSILPNTVQFSSSPDLLQLYGNCLPNKNHNFTLYKLEDKDGISSWYCKLCHFQTNGMGYVCEECGTKIDVKCASLPTTIRYSSHHKPLVLLNERVKGKGIMIDNRCYACGDVLHSASYYCSKDDCDFGLHIKCLLNPMSVRDREWDSKHPLLLTFDAYLDHPSDFFCDSCEEEMHPQMWMYHCRECDVSLHRDCLETAAGVFRNIKFGRRYELDGMHKNHPLTYTYITLKKRCDVCHHNYGVYTYPGFECADCYFVVCEDCGRKELLQKT